MLTASPCPSESFHPLSIFLQWQKCLSSCCWTAEWDSGLCQLPLSRTLLVWEMVWGIYCLIDQSTNAECVHVCTCVCVCTHEHVEGRGGVPSVVTNQTFALSLTHTSLSYTFVSTTSPFWKNMRLTSSPPHFFRIKHSLLQRCGYFQCRNAGLRERLTIRAGEPLSLPRCRVPLYKWAGSVRQPWAQVWAPAQVQTSLVATQHEWQPALKDWL